MSNFVRGILTGLASDLLLAYSPFILIGLVAAWWFWPSPVQDRVVLLPGPDGKAGAVIIHNGSEERRLDTAFAQVGVDGRGKFVPESATAESVVQRYGAALEARPARPVSFTVYFMSGSATELDAVSRAALGALKLELANRPAPEISVIGHTDSVGDREANDELSRQRAMTVRDLLIASGVHAAAIDVAGRGERELMLATGDETDEPLNRRVEISVR